MSGYLGTLFMGGVGLRLILPPAAAFNKFVGQVQNHLKKSGMQSQRLSDLFAGQSKKKLKTSTETANALVKSLDEKYTKGKMTQLRKELKDISQITGQARVKEARAAAQAIRGEASWKNRSDTIKSSLEDVEPKASIFGTALDVMQNNIMDIWAGLIGVAKTLIGAFSNAIQRSTMLIITFGFQLGMVARNFMTFEKELINANSIFQTTRENLYSMSDEVIKFGHEFGINYEDASRVLYQFASAGLTAEESMVALKDTLTLTMAVQGDFNTLGKLMVQVIKGFGLEMEQTEEIADKFAYTINKSLIEWKDLSAAVKFAMPFFVAAGQSVDQLLGSLQILTDRALEAGIAGRGLRQAIAQFVEHADDNNAAFRKLGVEILDTEGNMRDLTDIALQFSEAMGEDVSKMDIMMVLMKDLNIRGATAFVHLAQNAEEFQKAVDDLVNSQGASNEMALYQQASLTNQIQLLKNAIFSVFYLSDATYAGTGAINGFDYALKSLVETLKSKFIVTAADGSQVLTDFGYKLRDIAIKFIDNLGIVLENIVDIMLNLANAGKGLFDTMTMLFWAINELTSFLAGLDPWLVKTVVQMWMLTTFFGSGIGLAVGFGLAMAKLGNIMEDIHPWVSGVAKAIAVIVGGLGGAVIGGISGALTGAKIGGLAGLAFGPGALAGAGTGALYGGIAGAIAGFTGGAALTYGAMSAVGSMEEGAYTSSAEGITPLSSYSNEMGNTLVVDNAIFANDNLNYRMEEASTVSWQAG